NRWDNLSTHMPWVGMSPAGLVRANAEYFRGISKPSAVQDASAMDAAWLQGLVTTLNPQNQPGRLTLIHRFGAKEVAAALPKAIEAVRQTGQTGWGGGDPLPATPRTPHARQPRDDPPRHQDAPFREHPQGAGAGVPHPRRAGILSGRRAHRAHRGRRP